MVLDCRRVAASKRRVNSQQNRLFRIPTQKSWIQRHRCRFWLESSVKDVNSIRSLQQSEEIRASPTLHKLDGTSQSETDTRKVDLDTETEYFAVPNQASSPHLFLSLHTFAPKNRGVELGRGDSGEARQSPSKSNSLVDQEVQLAPDTKSTRGNQSSGLNWPMNSQASRTSDLAEKGGLEDELRVERPAVGSKDRQLAYRHVDMAGQRAEVSTKRLQQHIVTRSTAFDDLPRAVPRSFEDPMERHPGGVDLVPKPMASSLSGHIQLGRFWNGSNAQAASQDATNFLMGDRRQSPAFSNFGSDEAVANRPVVHRYGNDFNHQIQSVGTVPQPVPIAPGSVASKKVTRFDAELQDVPDFSTTSLHQASGATDGSAHMMGRSVVPKPVIQQLLDALIREPGRAVEVSLDPEELGRVRMKMSVADSSVVVSILAERPESLELLRRNIDQLAEEFRALGYSQIAFDFGDTQSGGSKSSTQASPTDNEPTVPEDPLPINRPAETYDRDGLDMRL